MRDIITKLEQLNVEKEQLNEGLGDMAHEAEKDHEVQMARSDCYKSAKYAVSIHKMLKDVSEMEGIDGWVASKLTKAADYLGSVKHYMEGQAMQDVELAVVPVAGDMTDAMTMPQESIEEVHESLDMIRDPLRKQVAQQVAKDIARGDYDLLDELMSVIDSHGYGELKSLADAYVDGMDDEEVTEGRLSMRQLASMDKDAARKIEAMVGPESKYADMGDYQEALYNAARKMGLVESKIDEAVISEDREVMVRATNIEYDGPALDKLPTDVNVKVMVNPGDGEDEIFDMVADELEDRYGVKVSGFDMKMMEGESLENLEELTKAQQDAIDAAPGRTIDDMKPAERDILKRRIRKYQMNPDGSLVNQSEPSKAHFKKMGYDKLMGVKIEDAVEEEDVIGDIIASLSKTKERMPMPKSKPAVPMQSKQKMANKMALPKSKPDMSMGQDKTTGDPRGILRQSKFSEWSKK